MRVCDLLTGSGRLQRGATDLRDKWREAKEQWSDQSSREFEETYLVPLAPLITQVLAAVRRLADVMEQAEKECSDPDRAGL